MVARHSVNGRSRAGPTQTPLSFALADSLSLSLSLSLFLCPTHFALHWFSWEHAGEWRWAPVPASEGHYILMPGDMLEFWTCGDIPALRHRVCNGSGRERRNSLVVFFAADDDTDASPVAPQRSAAATAAATAAASASGAMAPGGAGSLGSGGSAACPSYLAACAKAGVRPEQGQRLTQLTHLNARIQEAESLTLAARKRKRPRHP